MQPHTNLYLMMLNSAPAGSERNSPSWPAAIRTDPSHLRILAADPHMCNQICSAIAILRGNCVSHRRHGDGSRTSVRFPVQADDLLAARRPADD
jgi:hypothetical protein